MSINEKDIEKLKRAIQDGKEEKARLLGRLEGIVKHLKTEFDVDTIEEAKTFLKEMDESLEKKKENLETQIENLKKRFPWVTKTLS
jgi:chromosome segregation ATPase